MSFLADGAFLIVFVAGATLLSLAAYLVGQRVAGRGEHEPHREMASAMVARIGSLHGLILALVFAQEMTSYQRLEVNMAQEASAVADVFNDAARYDAQSLGAARSSLRDYARLVVEAEWPMLGQGKGLSADAWSVWDSVYGTVLDLQPANPRQESLRAHMLDRLHEISTARDMRRTEASGSFAGLFWFAALSGTVLIALGYYIHAPTRHNLVLLGLFSAYTGVILFLIYAFSNPFSPPAVLPPTAFGELLAAMT